MKQGNKLFVLFEKAKIKKTYWFLLAKFDRILLDKKKKFYSYLFFLYRLGLPLSPPEASPEPVPMSGEMIDPSRNSVKVVVLYNGDFSHNTSYTDLFNMYGISAFCFKYYLEKKESLNHASISLISNIPDKTKFCLFLYDVKATLNNDLEFVEKVVPILKNDGYVLVNNKPLIIIHTSSYDYKFNKKYLRWSELSKSMGVDGLPYAPA